MITYLLNFVLCSGLLLLVYRAFLGNEKLYKFNRFYLLFSLVFSLAVPLITIKVLPKQIPLFTSQIISPPVAPVAKAPVYQQVTAPPASPIVKAPVYQQTIVQPVAPIVNTAVHQQILQTPAQSYNYLPLLIAIYLIIAIGMLLRFTKNLYQINRSVAKNAIRAADGTKLILVDEEVTPHSFLNYVFINKKDYREGAVEPEIICHEQAHVQQLHSLDVLFVELLQVICWFNPVIPFYRRAIQLNHEFLADEAVIKSYDDTPAYQHLLLSKASQCGSLYLTSQFNYLTTKKRLIMMTKTTSAKIALYKQLAILPVLAAVVLLFSNKVIAQNITKPVDKSTTKAKKDAVPKWMELRNGKLIPRPLMSARYNVPKGEPIIAGGMKIIPPAKQDAPQNILDEYAALLKKDNLLAVEAGSIITFALPDQHRLQDLYNQMSKKQQDKQIILFGPVITPLSKNIPKASKLAEWKDAAKYDVWVDGKRIKNSELAKYKPSDFSLFESTKLVEDIYNDKGRPQIVLMTPAYYAKDCKQVLDDKYQLPLVRIVPGKTAKREAVSDFGLKSKIIPPSKQDAPQSVLDEYAELLKKHNLPPVPVNGQIGLNYQSLNPDRFRMQDLFDQMSKKQQSAQKIKFGPLLLPSTKRHPTDEQIKDWQDMSLYRVWIDGKKIDQAELLKYKSSDFDCYSIARLSPTTNPNYKKYHFEVNIMTPAYYIKYCKQTADERFRPIDFEGWGKKTE